MGNAADAGLALIPSGSLRASTGWPNPPRAQSTTLPSAIRPQTSSAVGGGARSGTALDQSEAVSAGGITCSHVDTTGRPGIAADGAQPLLPDETDGPDAMLP